MPLSLAQNLTIWARGKPLCTYMNMNEGGKENQTNDALPREVAILGAIYLQSEPRMRG